MKSVRTLIGALAVVTALSSATLSAANPLLQPYGLPGFILLPEQRFHPAVQRFMAEQALRAMPLQDGQLFYVYPRDSSNVYIEQMQIRYLEALLQSRANDQQADNEPQSRLPLPTR